MLKQLEKNLLRLQLSGIAGISKVLNLFASAMTDVYDDDVSRSVGRLVGQ